MTGTKKQESKRYGEIDFLRTLAIVLMVAYHLAYNLSVFYGWSFDVFSGGFWLLARTSANLFLLLTGISFILSWERSKRWSKYIHRGLFVFSCGLLVSAATYLYDPTTYVRFGILHLIGLSLIVLPLWASLRTWNALFGITLIIIGNVFLKGKTVSTSLFLPFGISPPAFSSVDYFPFLPWFGVILLGIAIGNVVYVRHRPWRCFILPVRWSERLSCSSLISLPSRYSLLIYLVHQPVLMLLLRVTLGSPCSNCSN